MGINATWGGNQAVAIDDRCASTDHDVDLVSGVRVTGLANATDASLANANARDANPVDRIEDHDISDEQVARFAGPE